jgi:hypothetical protein
MKPRIVNISICAVLVIIGASIAYIHEAEARRIESSIQRRRAENIAKVPLLEKQLENPSLSQEDKNKIEKELRASRNGMPNTPPYFPYNERVTGWPIGIALMLGGIACLFVKSSKTNNGAKMPLT